MNRSSGLLFALALAAMPAIARAQTWTVCFEPGLAVLTTEGYLGVQATATAVDEKTRIPDTRTPPRMLGRAVVFVADAGGDEPLQAARRQTLALELFRRGVRRAGSTSETPMERPENPDCASVRLGEREGFRSWHPIPIFFDSNSAVMTPAALSSLLWQIPGYERGAFRIQLRGNTDTAGSVEANQRLSHARASAVRDALIGIGVDETDIEVSSAGEMELAKATQDGVSEPLNRRVTIWLAYNSPR